MLAAFWLHLQTKPLVPPLPTFRQTQSKSSPNQGRRLLAGTYRFQTLTPRRFYCTRYVATVARCFLAPSYYVDMAIQLCYLTCKHTENRLARTSRWGTLKGMTYPQRFNLFASSMRHKE